MSLQVGSALQAAMSPKRGANKRCAMAASLREDDDETKMFKQAKESSTMRGVADESSFESSTTMRASMYALMTGSFWLTRCRRAVLTKYWVSAVQREAPDAINGAISFDINCVAKKLRGAQLSVCKQLWHMLKYGVKALILHQLHQRRV
jgi:hypothetical protein